MRDARATHEFREEKNVEGLAKEGRICIFIVAYRLPEEEIRYNFPVLARCVLHKSRIAVSLSRGNSETEKSHRDKSGNCLSDSNDLAILEIFP
jgi:hypothetical protein